MSKFFKVFIFGIVALCFVVQSFGSFATAQTVSGNTAPTNSSTAASSDLVRDAALIAPNTGWLLTEQHLRWTTDNGKTWRDITPTALTAISNVFFLDSQNGWVIGSDNSGNGYQIAHTSDAGMSWQTFAFAPTTNNQYSVATLDFADAQHGFLMLKVATSTNFSEGDLFATSDGGKTWKQLATPPIGDSVHFTSATDGWLAGGPAGDKLFVTHNGGNSWQQIQVTLPTGYEKDLPAYGLPTFQNATDGVLPLTLAGTGKSAQVFYVTHDGGNSWNVSQILPNSYDYSPGGTIATAIVGTDTVIAAPARNSNALTAVHLNSDASSKTSVAANLALDKNSVVTKLSFANATQGWAVTSSGTCNTTKTQCTETAQLLSVNGSYTQDITPSSSVTPKTVATATNQGFDKACAPSKDDMQTWKTNSPYSSIGIYLYDPSSYNETSCRYDNTNLTPEWVSETSLQGWTFILTWVGPQVLDDSVSTDLTTAYNQGVAAADSAITAAQKLGFTTPTVIYYDMEGYNIRIILVVNKVVMTGLMLS